MKAVISGVSGFVGSHLADALADKNIDVFAFPRELLLDVDGAKEFLEKIKPEYIFHLAAYGNMSKQQDEGQMLASNVIGTFTLLEASKLLDYRALVYISTSSVYGTKEKPMKETDVCETATYYGATKLSAEYLCKAHAERYNKPIAILRPFSLYGPNEAEFRFIPTVIKKIQADDTIQLEPSTNHDWTYVKDFTSACIVTAEKIQKAKGKVINVGTGNQYTNAEILDKIEILMQKKATVQESLNMREFKVSSWVADNTVMRSLGWKPKIDIISGLRETINAYTKQES